MGNINLATIEKRENTGTLFNTGLSVLIVFTVILGAFYGFIIWSGKNAVEQKDIADQEYIADRAKLISDKNRNVMDFQNRFIIIQEKIFTLHRYSTAPSTAFLLLQRLQKNFATILSLH